MRTIPTDTMPAIEAELVGGGHWTLAGEHPQKLALLAFYRGLHCPVCRNYVAELASLAPEFERRGVSVIALTCEARGLAERAALEWGLGELRVGYGVHAEDARKAGLYLSLGRGHSTVSNAEEPAIFAEPGVLAVKPDGTLYAAWIQSAPQARPRLSDILAALDTWLGRGLPEPRGAG